MSQKFNLKMFTYYLGIHLFLLFLNLLLKKKTSILFTPDNKWGLSKPKTGRFFKRKTKPVLNWFPVLGKSIYVKFYFQVWETETNWCRVDSGKEKSFAIMKGRKTTTNFLNFETFRKREGRRKREFSFWKV